MGIIVTTKLIGDYGADYSMVYYDKTRLGSVRIYMCKRDSSNRFTLHECNGTNNNVLEERMTYNECKKQIKVLNK